MPEKVLHYCNWSSQHDIHLACFRMDDPEGWAWAWDDEERIHTFDRDEVTCPACLEWLAEHSEAL